jgi:hypothetical protein
MPQEPAYLRNLKLMTRANPTDRDLPELEKEVYGGNDRARAVMLSAILEAALEIFIRNKTRPTLNSDDTSRLFDYSGLLGDFGGKILAGYAFNFYGPQTRHDLDLIRILRNEFAHSRVSFDFTTAEVAAVCAQLKAPDWPGAFIPHAWLEIVPLEDGDKTHPRTRFRGACQSAATTGGQSATVLPTTLRPAADRVRPAAPRQAHAPLFLLSGCGCCLQLIVELLRAGN